MRKLNQSGSHIVAVALLILVVGVVGLVGYRMMHHNSSTATLTPASSSSNINNKGDLQNTAKSLSNSSADVNSSLDSSSLNGDLNDLL